MIYQPPMKQSHWSSSHKCGRTIYICMLHVLYCLHEDIIERPCRYVQVVYNTGTYLSNLSFHTDNLLKDFQL